MTAIPSVLFVCVKNGGKSQMAAGLMRDLVGSRAEVTSAGTRPGTALNELSVDVLAEVSVDISAEVPQPIAPSMMRKADVVITLGREATVEQLPGQQIENWDTDEPSERGIEGIERMRLVREDIAARVRQLVSDLDLGQE